MKFYIAIKCKVVHLATSNSILGYTNTRKFLTKQEREIAAMDENHSIYLGSKGRIIIF